MKVYKTTSIKDNKTYTNIFLEFPDGFVIQVKPSFDLSSKQFKKYQYEINNFIDYKVIENENK